VAEAILGLIGVLIGAAVTVAAQYVMRLRDERADARTAARLMYVELANAERNLLLLKGPAPRPAFAKQSYSSAEWEDRRPVLARLLSADEWIALHRAYALLAQLAGVVRVLRDREHDIEIAFPPHVTERIHAALEVVARRAEMPTVTQDDLLRIEIRAVGPPAADAGSDDVS
jgi:hypothetical protein